jgi:hypothetical protein
MGSLKFVAKVVRVCNRNRGKFLTIRQISKLAKMSYNATYRTIQFLTDEGVVNLMKIGSAKVVQLTETGRAKGFVAMAESYSTNEGKNR